MTVLYEGIGEVLEALERRGCVVDREILVGAMGEKGLHCPLGDPDIDDLMESLTPMRVTTKGPALKMVKTLSSNRWRDTVTQSRQKLGVPVNGFTSEMAKELHDELLHATLGSTLQRSTIDVASVLQFWGRLVKEARPLAVILSMDPSPLDRLAAAFSPSNGIGPGGVAVVGGDPLIGLRKILNPEGVFKFGGKPVQYHPAPTDHVTAHILWGLPLSPDDLLSSPSIGYKWERTPDGGGRFIEVGFGFDRATAAELRELQASLRAIKDDFRSGLLRNFSISGTWEERWRSWNRMFPDFAYPSADAMRHAKANQRKNVDTSKQPGPNDEINRSSRLSNSLAAQSS